MSRPKYTINLGFMTEVQMMMGLKGSWVPTTFWSSGSLSLKVHLVLLTDHHIYAHRHRGGKTPKFVQ